MFTQEPTSSSSFLKSFSPGPHSLFSFITNIALDFLNYFCLQFFKFIDTGWLSTLTRCHIWWCMFSVQYFCLFYKAFSHMAFSACLRLACVDCWYGNGSWICTCQCSDWFWEHSTIGSFWMTLLCYWEGNGILLYSRYGSHTRCFQWYLVLFAFAKLCSNRSKVQSCSHRTDVNIMMKLVLHIQMKLICCLLKLNHFGK